VRHFILAMCAAALAVVASAGAGAQAPDPTFEKDIRRLLEMNGGLKLGQQLASAMVVQTLQALRRTNQNLPARAAEIIREEIGKEFEKGFTPDGEVTTGIARVYAKHFSHDEVRSLIAFYESPLGRKVVETLPAVAQESIAVGTQWGSAHMPAAMQRIQERLKKEGLAK
jgi:uncharacterized protein